MAASNIPTPEDTATETWEDVRSMAGGCVCISSRFRARVTVGEFSGELPRGISIGSGARGGTNCFEAAVCVGVWGLLICRRGLGETLMRCVCSGESRGRMDAAESRNIDIRHAI